MLIQYLQYFSLQLTTQEPSNHSTIKSRSPTNHRQLVQRIIILIHPILHPTPLLRRRHKPRDAPPPIIALIASRQPLAAAGEIDDKLRNQIARDGATELVLEFEDGGQGRTEVFDASGYGALVDVVLYCVRLTVERGGIVLE